MQQNDEDAKSNIGEARVTIGFTAKLDEVPHEAARLIEDISLHLDAATKLSADAARTFDISNGEIDFKTSYENLARCKVMMDRSGQRLHEVLLILSGFFRHKTGQTQVEKEDNLPDVEEVVNVDPFEIDDEVLEALVSEEEEVEDQDE